QAVARHIFLQDLQRIGAEAGQAHEFELEQQTRRGLAAAGGQTLCDDTPDPAAGVVFEPGDHIGQAAVAHAVVDATDAVPGALAVADAGGARRARLVRRRGAIVHRPLPADLELLAQAAGEAV